MKCSLLMTLMISVFYSAPVAAEDNWYPSKWGAEDTLGAINELSPEAVIEAAKLVKTGKTYSLGVETGRDTPAYGTRAFQLFARSSHLPFFRHADPCCPCAGRALWRERSGGAREKANLHP